MVTIPLHPVALLKASLALSAPEKPFVHPDDEVLQDTFFDLREEGQAISVEAFCSQYPTVTRYRGTYLNLIGIEFESRSNRDHPDVLQEFMKRFPDVPELPAYLLCLVFWESLL